jgi:uncharacterized protein YcfJ
MMKPLLIAACSTALMVSGCTTSKMRNDTATRAIAGAAAGAAIGALGGSAMGSDPFTGAVVGAVAGGAAGAAVPGKVFEGRQYYRDTRGYCYYLDRNGQPQYDGSTAC